jgi:uncharacterized protein with PIN domain
MAEIEPKFAVDFMLGRLAKWLRVLGYDAIYGRHLTGYGLIRAARAENRLILTRDRSLKKKQPPPFLFIDSNDHVEQLRQVLRACGLTEHPRLFSRCLVCNALLEPRPKSEVKDRVPDFVWSTQDRFSWCPGCRKLYWPATHIDKMLAQIDNIAPH